MKVLLIAPIYDVPTTISNRAVFEFYAWLTQNKIPTEFIWGPMAYRTLIESKINQFDLVCYFGHGVEDAIVGGNSLQYIIDMVNANIVTKPKVIWTMACLTGLKLGPEIAKSGVGYFGHTTYYYAAFAEAGYDYFKDWSEYISIIPKMLIQGKSTTEAMEIYQREITNLIEKYEREQIGAYDWVVETATKNRDYLRYFGPDVKIT